MAAYAGVAVAGTLWISGLADRPERARRIAAWAELAPLPTAPSAPGGSARVLAGEDRREDLHLHVSDLPLAPGYYEVWLIDPDTMRMISVGTIAPDEDALLPLPQTVDLNRYRLVDVSAEAYDGDTAHSGESLLRGTLTG